MAINQPPSGRKLYYGPVWIPAALIVCSTLLGSNVLAQAKPRKPKVLPGSPVELKTVDGWTLAAQYYPAKPGKLTFILLHQTGGRKEDWYYMCRHMAARGIGYLALDMRGHGGSQTAPEGRESNWHKFKAESKGYNEWVNMVHDVEAATAYLIQQGIPDSSIAVAGADVGGSIALRYAAVHREVPLIFMLSPGMKYREVLTVNAIRAYSQRPILMVVGADDKHSVPETTILFTFAKMAAGAQNAALITADREHGAKILTANRGVMNRILDWVENPSQPAAASSDTVKGTPPSESPAEDDLPFPEPAPN